MIEVKAEHFQLSRTHLEDAVLTQASLFEHFAGEAARQESVVARLKNELSYKTAQRKVQEYRARNAAGEANFADTTRKYNSLLALDADFAKKDFDNELLQHRDIDVRLRPLYRFSLSEQSEDRNVALSRRFENALLDRFVDAAGTPLVITNGNAEGQSMIIVPKNAEECFVKGLQHLQAKEFSSAL